MDVLQTLVNTSETWRQLLANTQSRSVAAREPGPAHREVLAATVGRQVLAF